MAMLSNSFYSGSLAVYFLFTVRFGWAPHKFARSIEPFLHIINVTLVVVVSVISLHWDVYDKNRIGPTCWMTNEHRGLYFVFLVLTSMTCIVIIAANLSIYLYVRTLTMRSSSRSLNPEVATNRKHMVAAQSFSYVAAYTVTYTPAFIMGLHDSTGGALFRANISYFLYDMLYIVLLPLTGFLNLMVFLRPQYIRFREQYSNATRWRCFRLSLSNALMRGTTRRRSILRKSEQIAAPQHVNDNTPICQEFEEDAENNLETGSDRRDSD